MADDGAGRDGRSEMVVVPARACGGGMQARVDRDGVHGEDGRLIAKYPEKSQRTQRGHRAASSGAPTCRSFIAISVISYFLPYLLDLPNALPYNYDRQ